MSGNNTVIVDSDAIIGLLNETDGLHNRCVKISHYLQENKITTVIPYPIVLEAATALAKDKTIRRPDLAKLLLRKYASIKDNGLETTDIPFRVAELYHPATSKKNTPFDFYVLAFAKKNGITTVFSFDSFYGKNGLQLIEQLIEESTRNTR